MFSFAARFTQDFEQAFCANVVERVNYDSRVTLAILMSGEPECDRISGPLIIARA